MNKYESFRRAIIEKASVPASSGGPIHVRSFLLAAEHNIPEEHAREQLRQLEAEGLIRLAAWDGRRERPYSEWPDADLFFFNRTDHGYVRIWLRSPGAELLSQLPKGPLGFWLR
jgi:DNA-binding GntR family transcriptional regulator